MPVLCESLGKQEYQYEKQDATSVTFSEVTIFADLFCITIFIAETY